MRQMNLKQKKKTIMASYSILQKTIKLVQDETSLSSKRHKVSKGAKIRNRYNQVPQLTQDTNEKVINSQLYTTNESQEVSPFPAGDHKAQKQTRTKAYQTQNRKQNIKDPQKKYTLERSVKYFTGWLKPVSRRQPRP